MAVAVAMGKEESRCCHLVMSGRTDTVVAVTVVEYGGPCHRPGEEAVVRKLADRHGGGAAHPPSHDLLQVAGPQVGKE